MQGPRKRPGTIAVARGNKPRDTAGRARANVGWHHSASAHCIPRKNSAVLSNFFNVFDDSAERPQRDAFYAVNPAVQALQLVAMPVAAAGLVLAVTDHPLCSPVGLTWAALAALRAAYEWRAGFRVSAKNHLVRVLLLLPSLLMVWFLRTG